jgi:hypothetical protein
MSALEFGTDGLLQDMSHGQQIAGTAVGYWQIAKPVLYRLDIKPEMLPTPWDRVLLEAVFNVDLRDDEVTYESALAEVESMGLLPVFKQVGGAGDYVAAVVGSVIVPRNVPHHARKVLEVVRAQRRVGDKQREHEQAVRDLARLLDE